MQTVTTYYHVFRQKQQSLFSVWILYPVCKQCLACSLHFEGTCSLHSWQDSWAGERRFGREWEFNPTFQQSSHGFSTETKALICEIPPATQAMAHVIINFNICLGARSRQYSQYTKSPLGITPLKEIRESPLYMAYVYYRLFCLALINRAGGLYGRIWTKVLSTDQMQWGLYKRPRSRFSYIDRLRLVNKIFII